MSENKTVENGNTVGLNFDLMVDGELVSSSQEDGPLTFTIGEGQVVPGLEAALLGLKLGDSFDVVIPPEEGYGSYDENAFESIGKDSFADEIEVGEDYYFEDENGDMIVVTIAEINKDEVVVDYNHPLTGKTLNFKGTVAEIN